MSDQPTNQTPSGDTPAPTGRKKSRAGRGGKSKPDRTSGPPKPPDPSLGFSEGTKILENAGLSISGRIEEVPSDLRTEDYFHSVQIAYQELLHVKPEIQDILSFPEWKHIHALLFYHRVQDVEFKVTGIKQPARTRTPVPYDTKVFQPLWAVLAEIGVVLDPELSVKYFPIARMPQTQDLSDPEDIDHVLDCTMYPWDDSWLEAREARAERIARNDPAQFRPETLMFAETAAMSEKDYSELRTKIVDALQFLKTVTKYWDPATGNTDGTDGTWTFNDEIYFHEVIDASVNPNVTTQERQDTLPEVINYTYSDDAGWVFSIDIDGCNDFSTLAEIAAIRKHLVEKAKLAKEGKLIFRPRLTQPKTTTFDLGTVSYSGTSGAYGAWLGSDGQLWTDYSHLCDVVTPVALFSLSFPKEITDRKSVV